MKERQDKAGVIAWLARGIFVVATALLACVAYGWMRTSSGPIDRNVIEKLGYALRAGVLPGMIAGLFVVPAVMLLEIHWRCNRPLKRLRNGLCPTCTYPLARSEVCPECGVEPLPPRLTEWQVTYRTLVGICLLLLLGTLIGSAIAEALILPDERAFKAEAKAAGAPYARLRNGPFYGELSYSLEGVFWVVDD